MPITVGVNLVAALAFGLLPEGATAATAAATFTVTATVAATCLISTTAIALGAYTGAVATATGTVTITCTNTTTYNIGLSAGLATDATVSTRKMTLNAATLNYVLTQDAAHATNWGLTVGTDTVTGTGTGAVQPLTVYGQVAAGQYVAPGAYTDTITATVTY